MFESNDPKRPQYLQSCYQKKALCFLSQIDVFLFEDEFRQLCFALDNGATLL